LKGLLNLLTRQKYLPEKNIGIQLQIACTIRVSIWSMRCF
jgi:hypothetical protein